MPLSLDFPEIAEAFHQTLLLPIRPIARSFERLARWLPPRLERAHAFERATRRFPILRFFNDALSMWVDGSQKHALAPNEPAPSFGDRLKEGGDRFVKGLGDTVALPKEEFIIPDFLDTANAAMQQILASVERFQKPAPDLFDVGGRTADTLLGEAALGFRALYFSKDQIEKFAADVRIVKGPEKAAAFESVYATSDSLERWTRLIVAGLYLIVLLPEFIRRLWIEVSIFARTRLLDIFGKIEEQAFGVRRRIIDLFHVDLRATLKSALGYALAWGVVASAYFEFLIDLVGQYSKMLIAELDAWFLRLKSFVDALIGVFKGLKTLLDGLARINLMPVLIEKLGWKGWAAQGLAETPSVTLGDLVDERSRSAAHTRLKKWIDDIEDGLPLIVKPFASKKLEQARSVLALALTTKTKDVAETGAFALDLPKFPDVYKPFAGGVERLQKSMGEFAEQLKGDTDKLVERGVKALSALGVQAERGAAQALRGPDIRDYQAIYATAAAKSERVFGDDAEALRKRAATIDPTIAQIFQSWVARGGIEVVGEIIPRYAAAMRRYWEEREARGEEATVKLPDDLPTSPHILAQNPRLARTMVPSMTIVARGRALDDTLVNQIATAFADLVQGAHRSGLQELASIQAAAGR